MSAGEASKRDTKSKRHPSMRLAPVRVFSRKHPLTRVHPRSESYFGSQRGWILIFVTIQILVVLLIGESKFLTNQNYYPDLGSDTSSVWNFCVRFSDVISRGNQWWRREMSVVFSG